MNLTAKQHENISRGMKRIKDKANYAVNSYYADVAMITGTYFSKREPRTYRGRRV